MDHVAELEARFLSRFQEAAEQIGREYPDYTFNAWSSPTGSATAYQGHDVGVECIFPDATDHETNCVAAYVGVMHLTTEPMLCEFCVAWGSGHHPDVDVDFIEHAAPMTRESLDEVAARVPDLLDVFQAAISAWATRSGPG